MSWASDYPEELLNSPTGLVVLTGIDTQNNAVHRAVWDTFCNNKRSNRVLLKFKQQNADFDYSKSKPKRTSYDWYIPKGIIKKAWMKKHLELIPSLVVLFFDLDWDNVMWKEKQMECATRVQIVRESLVGRSTKVCIVLLQKNVPLPPGEDMVATDRASSLCSVCDLSNKFLFVLPVTDHLLGYAIRLENAFSDLSRGYYHSEARKTKTHKDYLNKTTHALLFVRHQFKIAFFNELKHDSHTALKHYKQAYGFVMELRLLDFNNLEIKAIAGFINYKICHLCFLHNTPLDAISQFRKHIDFFKNKIGMPELTFEHSAWIAKQFHIFGDLFDEAIKQGLSAILTQHPGIYFQQAVHHTVNRRSLIASLSKNITTSPIISQDFEESLNNLDYYGQRPWRQGHQSIEPPDLAKEKYGILSLQILELQVDHSKIIIPLLCSAVSQSKKYKSPRMKRHLTVQLLEEYYVSNDFDKSLCLLPRVTLEYRQERWWNILTSILITSLKCAYLSASLSDYVTISIELIGIFGQISKNDKFRIQSNLFKILEGGCPDAEPNCKESFLEKAALEWKNLSCRTEPNLINIEMNIYPFVECRVQFEKEFFPADAEITLFVYLRSHAPAPMKFEKLFVTLNNQVYNKYCILENNDKTDDNLNQESLNSNTSLLIEPKKIWKTSFKFVSMMSDVNKQLEITSLTLVMGSTDMVNFNLVWTELNLINTHPSVIQQTNYFPDEIFTKEDSLWENLPINLFTRLIPRKSNIGVKIIHNSPGFINECLVVKINVQNLESYKISNVRCSIVLDPNTDPQIKLTTTLQNSIINEKTKSGNINPVLINLANSLGVGANVEGSFFFRSSIASSMILYLSVTYDIVLSILNVDNACRCMENHEIFINIVEPIDIEIQLLSLKMENLESTLIIDQPFLLLSNIIALSEPTLEIVSSKLVLNEFIFFEDKDTIPQLENLILQKEESCSECFCLIIKQPSTSQLSLGFYTVVMKRKDISNSENQTLSKTIPLPTVALISIPLKLELNLPSYGIVQICLQATYTFNSLSPFIQNILVLMESTDAFMFAGHKQISLTVLPYGQCILKYNLVPLAPGYIELPKIKLSSSRLLDSPDLEGYITKNLPTSIFIRPRSRELECSSQG